MELNRWCKFCEKSFKNDWAFKRHNESVEHDRTVEHCCHKKSETLKKRIEGMTKCKGIPEFRRKYGVVASSLDEYMDGEQFGFDNMGDVCRLIEIFYQFEDLEYDMDTYNK